MEELNAFHVESVKDINCIFQSYCYLLAWLLDAGYLKSSLRTCVLFVFCVV